MSDVNFTHKDLKIIENALYTELNRLEGELVQCISDHEESPTHFLHGLIRETEEDINDVKELFFKIRNAPR